MLISDILLEAKEILDLRHENIEDKFKFFGSTKTSEYIPPSKGFYWIYDKGTLLIFSTTNSNYSWLVSTDNWRKLKDSGVSTTKFLQTNAPRILSTSWNKLGGVVDFADETVSISKEEAGGKFRQRTINDIKTFKKALLELMKYGVKPDFKVKGGAGVKGTVGEILKLIDPREQLFGSNEPLVMYHGTSSERWEQIRYNGLRPGNTGEVYIDLVPGYSEHNIYLATTPKAAEFYAKRQAKKDDSKPVILKITVPDKNKIIADDAFIDRNPELGTSARQIKISLKELGSVAYRGSILPIHIKKIRG